MANNKLLIDVSVSMPAAIALDIILPHMSKSIFTEKLAANFGLKRPSRFSIEHIIFPQPKPAQVQAWSLQTGIQQSNHS